jgi:hypothetical protein
MGFGCFSGTTASPQKNKNKQNKKYQRTYVIYSLISRVEVKTNKLQFIIENVIN